MNRRVWMFVAVVGAVAVSCALYFTMHYDVVSPAGATDAAGAARPASGLAGGPKWSDGYYGRLHASASAPLVAQPVPKLSNDARRAGESDVAFEGRIEMLQHYREWLDEAKPSDEVERQVRRILADGQLNLSLYQRAQREAIELAVEDGVGFERGRPVHDFNAEVNARLAEVLDEKQLELFDTLAGGPWGFCAFEPLDLPDEVAAAAM